MKRFLVPLLLITLLVIPIAITTGPPSCTRTAPVDGLSSTAVPIGTFELAGLPALCIADAEAAVWEYEQCCAEQHSGWCCALVRLNDWWEDFWNDGGSHWDW